MKNKMNFYCNYPVWIGAIKHEYVSEIMGND